jgi:hypothetical protein
LENEQTIFHLSFPFFICHWFGTLHVTSKREHSQRFALVWRWQMKNDNWKIENIAPARSPARPARFPRIDFGFELA